VAGALAGAGLVIAIALSCIGVGMVWPMLQSVDDARAETALGAFKRNALIGAAVLIAFALEPAWRTLRPVLGM
jgi:hypothetical protein